MRITSLISAFILLIFLLPIGVSGAGDPVVTVAVAANALRPVEEIVRAFETEKNVKVRLVHGSTGKLYTQIVQGAPYDIFLAADRERPALLVKNGFTGSNRPFIYARGSLVLWTMRDDLDLAKHGMLAISNDAVGSIAIANPRTAPYGRAAIEAINTSGLKESVEGKLVYGESVSQAFSYARTGNAEFAITALSTIYGQTGIYIVINPDDYGAILQDAVVLNGAPAGADAFAEFLKGERAREILERYGYMTKEGKDE